MIEYSIERLIRITASLSMEKDLDTILEMILNEAMYITDCDGGTVYYREGDFLLFKHLVTLSKGIRLGGEHGEIKLPPVPLGRKHVCACAALDKKRVNIPDVYESKEYDFSGAQKYDSLNGYRTASMLVMPMQDLKGEVIGVLQLINAKDGNGDTIPFNPEFENLISALSSLAAVSLNNTLLTAALTDILHSFVQVMVDAVDARTSYNANHTKSMVRYGQKFVDWLAKTDNPHRLPDKEKDPFLMAIWLHDIGKLVIPLEIMDKPTRLAKKKKDVIARIRIGKLMERIHALENPEEAALHEQKGKQLDDAAALIEEANTAGFLNDEIIARLEAIRDLTCATEEGEIPLFTKEEFAAITLRRGTLTPEEKAIMENHVVYTGTFLDRMKFDGDYKNVPLWARSHHELLDGSGYPNKLTAKDLPFEVRLLTILDIYDALTAEDRPYKPAMAPEKAFKILESMRDEGKLDGEILSLFEESKAWRTENDAQEAIA